MAAFTWHGTATPSDVVNAGPLALIEPLLDKLDRVIASLPPGDPIRRDLLDLRPHVSDQSQMIGEARQMIEKLEEVIKKVTSPANRIGSRSGRPTRVPLNCFLVS